MLESHGAVSAETALAMAEGARRSLGADVAVATTGSAGPEPMEQPVGTMFFAVVTPEAGRSRQVRLPGDRERVRVYATTAALHAVRLAVSGEWW
jgi:nicotinamide-nucleotide amidase